MADPSTKLHYAPNANMAGSTYAPGADGFNLADVSSVGGVNALPAGVQGLVYLGYTGGDTAAFQSMVQPFIGDSKVYGFYLADEPGPNVSAANLKAESDYIHSVDPGAKTFIVLENNGTPTSPSYSFNPANTDVDLYGLDPYPIRPQFTGGANYSVIGDAVNAAEAEGISQADIVPVYQAFGATSGAYAFWALPTAAQEQTILSTWGKYTPAPAFDYAYSWGAQDGDTALSDDPSLQAVFKAYNDGSTSPAPSDPPPPDVITPKATAIDAAAGKSFSGVVATFTDSNTSITPSGLTATIRWGDGTTASGTISGGNGSFSVSGAHTYSSAGTEAVNVTLTEKSPGTATATADSRADVSSAAPPPPSSDVIVPSGMTIDPTTGKSFSGTVATFTDSDTSVQAGGLTATISWGDGTKETAGVVSGSDGSFSVSGTHAYSSAGTDRVDVTLTEKSPGTAAATADSRADITASSPPTRTGGTTPTSGTSMTATARNGTTANVSTITSGSSSTAAGNGKVLQSVTSGVDEVSFRRIRSEDLSLGSGDVDMHFIAPRSLTLAGGSGTDTISATSGRNHFVAGTGTLNVTGGAGRNAYTFHAGDGLLRIDDFRHRDSLTVDKSLRSSMQEKSDGHGGTLLTFGTSGRGIDLVGVSSFRASAIHFA